MKKKIIYQKILHSHHLEIFIYEFNRSITSHKTNISSLFSGRDERRTSDEVTKNQRPKIYLLSTEKSAKNFTKKKEKKRILPTLLQCPFLNRVKIDLGAGNHRNHADRNRGSLEGESLPTEER